MNKIVALGYLSDNYIFPRKVSTYHPDLKETFFHTYLLDHLLSATKNMYLVYNFIQTYV